MANRETFRNARIIFKNFAGKQTEFNQAGKRNFSILIEDEDEARKLMDEGWNVRKLKERPDTPQAYHLKVNVRFDIRPPKIKMVTYPNGKMKTTDISEESISSLDWMEIEKLDLTITPYNYSKGMNSGTTAYLDVMYVTPVVDVLTEEYETEEDALPFE